MKFKKRNRLAVIVTIAILCFTKQVSAQFTPQKKFKDRYKELAQKETNTMKERYHLNALQLEKIKQLNDIYYHEINLALQNAKNLTARRERIAQIQRNRESQLQTLLTKKQYSAYRNDMDAIELKMKRRQEEFNREAARRRQIIQVPNN